MKTLSYFTESYRPYLLLTIIGLAVYFQTLFFGYTHWDDHWLILEKYFFNKDIHNFTEIWKRSVFQVDADSYYRPVLTMSFMANAIIGGKTPFIYHLTNILFHLTSCCLLFLLLKKLNFGKELSLLFTLFFTVHPVLSQAVAWIPGRNDPMLAILIMLSFISFLNFLKKMNSPHPSPLQRRGSWKWFVLHLLFFTLALFTKETAGVFPVVCLAYLFLIEKTKANKQNIIVFFICWFVLILSVYLIRYNVLRAERETFHFNPHNVYEVLYSIPVYFGKIFFPFNLSSFPVSSDVQLTLGIISLLLLGILLYKGIANKKMFWFGIIWFFIFFFPTMVFQLKMKEIEFLEHRIYLPMIGFVFAFSEINLVKNNFINKWQIFFPILILFSAISFLHSKIFSDSMTFWKEAVRTSPNYFYTHYGLGQQYLDKGMWKEGERETRISIQQKPEYWLTHNNLGVAYFQKGMKQEAEAEFRISLSIQPKYTEGLVNLGNLYLLNNDFTSAMSLYEKALGYDSSFVKAYYNIGFLFLKQNKNDEAIYYFYKTLSFFPDFPERCYFSLGDAYFNKSEWDNAIMNYLKVTEINPKIAEPFIQLSKAYYQKGDGFNTKLYFDKAQKINPNLK